MADLFSNAFAISVGALALTACASSLPSNFEYKTSLRGEQGFVGQGDRIDAAQRLLAGGIVTNPELALRKALPDADVDVRKWGLRYFGSNWARYQIVLNADIHRGDTKTKCREVSTETPVGAPTLPELIANDSIKLRKELDALIAACVDQFTDLT